MTYADAIRFLYDQQMFGSIFGLERVRRLAELAGNPHERLRFIHVAGTNGKGSVCAMLESIHRAAGRRTGLFTSPHLVHFGERMEVNRRRPSEGEIVRLVERLREWLAEGAARGWWEAPDAKGCNDAEGRHSCRPDHSLGDRNVALPASHASHHPTFFEIVTVMALLHFVEERCDLVLWETGLGGRLDATNLVTPLASVITNVSLEHAQFLGDSVTKIAAEKSGIIKPGVPVVTAAGHPDALRVIHDVAAGRGSDCIVVDPENSSAPAIRSLPAGYQRINARLAIAVVEALQSQLPVTPSALETGLAQFHWLGRLQEITQGPRRFLVDGAHNPAGMRALRETLQARPGWRPVPVIFGSFSDKDVAGVLSVLAPLASTVWCVPVATPRSMNPEQVARLVANSHPGLPVFACSSLAEAIDQTANEPLTLITGSLYLVGEAIERLSEATAAIPTTAERPLNDWAPAGTVAP